jgi:hypothetical protein
MSYWPRRTYVYIEAVEMTADRPVITLHRACYVSLLRKAALGLLCELSPPGVSTRATTREHPAAEGGTVGEKCPGILPKFWFPRYI